MAKRICDVSGKERDVSGEKVCSNGHFVCKDCVYSGGGLFASARKTCPLCGTPLR